MQQCINITILFYFTSHKQRKNKEKLLQKLFVICYSFHQRYGELATNDMEDTYAQSYFQNLKCNSWIFPEGVKSSAAAAAVVKKISLSMN